MPAPSVPASGLGTLPAFAAETSDAEYAALTALAQREGAAHVVVTVAQLSLPDLGGGDAAKLMQLRASEQALLQELAGQIWPFGQWNNQLGQLGLYATPAALQTLRSTHHAVSFRGGVHELLGAHRTRAEFRWLEAQLPPGGSLDTVVRIRNEAAAFDITASGALSVSGGMAAVSEHQTRAARVLAALRPEDVANLAQAQAALKAAGSQPALTTLVINLRVNHRALAALATHVDVASLHAAQQPAATGPIFDERALSFARADGYAHVLLLLRDPTGQAVLSPREAARALAAKQRAFAAVLVAAGVKTVLRDLAVFGVAAGVLPRAELERLFEAQDARLAGIAINGPVAMPTLNRSIPRMDASVVWAAGYQGAFTPSGGAQRRMRIAVVDSGIAKNHPMLVGKVPVENGVSYEACFGTNSNRFVTQYRSVCRGAPPPPSEPGGVAGSFGASGVAGDAESLINTAHCTGQSGSSLCDHGTQVAAIAAGTAVTLPGLPGRPGPLTLSGVAPGADIVPVQALSLNSSGVGGVTFFAEDLLAALNAVLAASPEDPALNDWVVNLSLGGTTTTSTPCTTGTPDTYGLVPPASPAPTNEVFVEAVRKLTMDRGVPVIAAAGNQGAANGLSWPACLPGVIKVSSANNPATTAHVVAQFFANLVPVGTDTAFDGDYLMIATGGGNLEGDVYSALANTIGGLRYGAAAGTSYAAPHVAGAYAVVKAGFRKLGLVWTVNNGSAYLYDTASVNAIWTDPENASNTRTYRSIRFVAPPP